MSPITVTELADHRLGRLARTGADYAEASLPIMGGCVGCGASIAAYNAYPSKSGYLACADCVGDGGWDTVEQANRDIFPEEWSFLCPPRSTRYRKDW